MKRKDRYGASSFRPPSRSSRPSPRPSAWRAAWVPCSHGTTTTKQGHPPFADGCPLSYSLINLCDFPNASQSAIDQINFYYVENFAKIFYNRFRHIRSLLSPLKSGPVEYESNNPGKRGTEPRVSQPWSDRPSSTSNCTIFSLITSPPIRRTAKWYSRGLSRAIFTRDMKSCHHVKMPSCHHAVKNFALA